MRGGDAILSSISCDLHDNKLYRTKKKKNKMYKKMKKELETYLAYTPHQCTLYEHATTGHMNTSNTLYRYRNRC